MNKYSYDTGMYNLKELMHDILDEKDLSQIGVEEEHELYDNPHKDQSSKYHKKYYKNVTSKFFEVYDKLASEIATKIFPDARVAYQRKPTFRIHLKDNLAVGEFHKDKAYSHDTEEVNVFLPLTPAYGNNTIWVESEEDKGDYQPMNCDLGQYIVWDGANLMHGNKLNDTSGTRVSIDFRFIKLNDIKDTGKESISTGTPMTLGKYWKECK
jgi:hypothetical protein